MSNHEYVHEGIEIVNFLKHKYFLITGSTGFVAKVFIEKLLRKVPEVQKIYLLIRAKTPEEAQHRLKSEIIDCEAFKHLKEEHGGKYEEFMRTKLVGVAGNLCSPCIGIGEEQARVMAHEIDVIINSAGNTRWHDRYDVLLDVNVRGVSRLVDFAMDCKKRILFLHVSTAYVTRERAGVVQEKQVGMEEIINEQSSNLKAMDIEAELQMVSKLASSSSMSKGKIVTEMSKLSLRRAKIHGWHNAYQLTKAMGETLLNKPSEKFSTVIIRPTFIEGSISDPFHGWIEGYRGMDPMILFHGKGQLKGILGDPTTVVDVVPVDMVVNVMLAATVYHGIEGKLGLIGLHIYHLASFLANPLLCQNLFKYSYNYFTMYPFQNAKGETIQIKEMEFYTSMDEYIMVGLNNNNNISSNNDHLVRNLVRMTIIYAPAMFRKVRFDIRNTQALFDKMTWNEKIDFQFDVKCIDREHYFMNIHFSGLKKHLLKKKFLITAKL